MDVRRRTAETVRPSSENAGEEQPTSRSSNDSMQVLIDKGTRLLETCKESGFQEVAKLTQGLKFLASAAEKGSDEAIERLKDLLLSPPREGFSSVMDKLPYELVSAVKVMVKGSEAEKQIYKIASDIFSIVAAGKDFILKNEIDSGAERLLKSEVDVSRKESSTSAHRMKMAIGRLLRCSVTTGGDGKELVTREGFCAIACMYARGELILPLEEASESDDITTDRQKEFQQANLLRKVIDFPAMTARYSGEAILKSIEKYGVRWLWSYISLNKLYLFGVVYFVPTLSASFILSVLATLAFFGSLAAMTIATLQIFARSSRVSRYKEYSTIFQCFSDCSLAITTRKAEVKFMLSLAVPYITFGIALLLFMLTMGLAFQQVVVYELLAGIGGFLAVAVAVHFQYWNSPVILIALLSRLVSWTDVFLHLVDDNLVSVPKIFFLFSQQVIPIFPGFSLGLSLTSLIQIPVHLSVVLHLLVHHTWYNFFAGVGPYILCLSWWLFCKYFVSHSSLPYLALVVFGLPCLLIVIPALPVVFVLSPILLFFYFGFTMKLCVSLAVLTLIGCAILVVTFYYSQLKEARWLSVPFDYLILANVVMCTIGLVAVSSYLDTQYSSLELSHISVQQYSQLCGPEYWKETGNMLESQLSCLHLQGRVLHGKGHIQSVKMSKIFNSKAATADIFPGFVRSAFTCLVGSADPLCGRNANAVTCVHRGCHFDASNHYLVTISLHLLAGNHLLPDAADMTVRSSHKSLQNSFLVHLRKGDQMKFNATLEGGMGSNHLSLKLKSAFINETLYPFEDEEHDLKGTMEFVLFNLLTSFKHYLLLFAEILFGYSDSFNVSY